MNNETLTIPGPTKEETLNKHKKCFEDILKTLNNNYLNNIEKLTLISYYSQLALDETIIFKEFDLKKPDNTTI